MSKPKSKKTKKKRLKFKYVIPDQLIDCYVNGVFGGVTPRQEIHMHAFSERNPIPEEVIVEFEEGSKVAKETAKVVGGDIIRLIQASLVMDVSTAEAIRDWLDDKIKFIKDIDKEEKPKSTDQKLEK